MTSPLEQYADFYNAANDSYDLDAYAAAVHLDELGMWTPAYEALVLGDKALMEAYNDERGRSTSEQVKAWLARFERGIGLPVVAWLWFVMLVMIALVVSA